MSISNHIAPRSGLLWASLLGVIAVIVLAFAPSASAQSICDEYPDLPQCVDPGDGGGENPGDGDDEGDEDDVAGGAGPTADLGDGTGELPFTGYPVTPLVLFLLALLAAGVILRSYLYLKQRLADRGPPAAH